jgi:hypothetical protein
MDKPVDHVARRPPNDVRLFRSTDRRPRDFEGADRLATRIAFRKSQSLKTNARSATTPFSPPWRSRVESCRELSMVVRLSASAIDAAKKLLTESTVSAS